MADKDFITEYLKHTAGTEVPAVFNRWSCIAGLGAWAKQDIWLPHIGGKLFPNTYTLIIGSPGARKSTAIKGIKRLLERAGYKYFAGNATSKEAFLQDLMERSLGVNEDDFEDMLFSTIGEDSDEATPVCIAADEFNDFFSNNMMEFLSVLGSLWDHKGEYTTRAKSGNVTIQNPNVSMLTGNTVDTLCRTFPVEALGQGFFSRMLFIYGEPNGIKIAFPELPDEDEVSALIEMLHNIKGSMLGEMPLAPDAEKALEKIYVEFKGIDDERFVSYDSRRFVHLLKLCMIHALSAGSPRIEMLHVIRAHTVLVAAEYQMPKALGEYGISRNSVITHKIMKILNATYTPIPFRNLLSQLSGDIDNVRELGQIMDVLINSDKAEFVRGDVGQEGYLPKRRVREAVEDPLLDWSYLTEEERESLFQGEASTEGEATAPPEPDAFDLLTLSTNQLKRAIRR